MCECSVPRPEDTKMMSWHNHLKCSKTHWKVDMIQCDQREQWIYWGQKHTPSKSFKEREGEAMKSISHEYIFHAYLVLSFSCNPLRMREISLTGDPFATSQKIFGFWETWGRHSQHMRTWQRLVHFSLPRFCPADGNSCLSWIQRKYRRMPFLLHEWLFP